MRVSRRLFLAWWISGLIAFAIVIAMSAPLMVEGVPGGITDHQAAPDAARVDAIQTAWDKAGVLEWARWSMIADLVFIGIYGVGSVLGGLYFRSAGRRALGAISLLAITAGTIFLITDYTETIAQFVQLVSMRGDDALASIASACRPLKVASWVVTFVAIVAGLAFEAISKRRSG